MPGGSLLIHSDKPFENLKNPIDSRIASPRLESAVLFPWGKGGAVGEKIGYLTYRRSGHGPCHGPVSSHL